MASDPPLRLEETDSLGRPVRRSLARRTLAWFGRHPVLILAVIALLIPNALGLHWWYLPNYPTRKAEEVESIEVRLRKYEPNSGFGPGYEQSANRVTTDEPVVIQGLLNAFRSARRAEEHNCGSSGTITVRRKDGMVEEIEILPGHEDAYYEYRLGSRISKVDREPFLAALRAMGVTQVKTVPP